MIDLDTRQSAVLTRSRNYINLTAASDTDRPQAEPDRDRDRESSSRGPDRAAPEQVEAEQETYHYIDYSQLADAGYDCAPSEPDRAEETAEDNKLLILRELLAIERDRNERRRRNNLTLQDYIAKLQSDYLRLQRDLVQELELGHKIKAQKEAQIDSLAETVREKDDLIEQLRERLDELEDGKVRQEFKTAMDKQSQLFQLEREQLARQVDILEQQCQAEQEKSKRLIEQHGDELESLKTKHKLDLENLNQQHQELQYEIERLLCEPSHLLIKSLEQERGQLEHKLEEMISIVGESRSKYESVSAQVQDLINEHELTKVKSQEEIERLEEQCLEQHRAVTELRSALTDKEEVIQIAQFNLQRSEKRVKSLLSTLRTKELAYQELLDQMQLEHEQELAKVNLERKAMEKISMGFESELDKKQNQIVRLELEHSNQIESIKTDRDERVKKLFQERQKVEREVQLAEIKLAKEVQEKEQMKEVILKLERDRSQFQQESKRLSIELTKSEAQLYCKIQEVKLLRDKCNNSDYSPSFQEDQLRLELEAEKRRSRRFEETVDELQADCQKLIHKLKISESKLSKINSSFSREQTKLVAEYEKKLEQIRNYQSLYDKSRIKYRRYGYKLRNYCEHLRKVHKHLCNPSLCGYSISPDDLNSSRQQE